MLKQLFTTSLLGMLCCTSLVIGSDFSNSNNAPSWEDVAMDTVTRHRSGRHRHRRCERILPKTHAADGVRQVFCNSDQSPIYQREYKFLLPFIPSLTTLTHNAQNSNADYALLLAEAINIVNGYNAKFGVTTGRVVITDSDGLVLVDTGKSNNTLTNANDGANPSTFALAINVNHQSRISILDAQQYDIGVGFETKFSNSVGTNQIYTAIRLGPILNNSGTARLSQNE